MPLVTSGSEACVGLGFLRYHALSYQWVGGVFWLGSLRYHALSYHAFSIYPFIGGVFWLGTKRCVAPCQQRQPIFYCFKYFFYSVLYDSSQKGPSDPRSLSTGVVFTGHPHDTRPRDTRPIYFTRTNIREAQAQPPGQSPTGMRTL